MSLIGQFLYQALEIYSFIIIATIIFSWLAAFNVVSMSNPTARKIMSILGRLTDPVLRPVQRFIPSIGGIDISPIVVIFGIMLLQRIIVQFLIMPSYAV